MGLKPYCERQSFAHSSSTLQPQHRICPRWLYRCSSFFYFSFLPLLLLLTSPPISQGGWTLTEKCILAHFSHSFWNSRLRPSLAALSYCAASFPPCSPQPVLDALSSDTTCDKACQTRYQVTQRVTHGVRHATE